MAGMALCRSDALITRRRGDGDGTAMNSYAHRQGVVALYRLLARRVARLERARAPPASAQCAPRGGPGAAPLAMELHKYGLNPPLYTRYLAAELRRCLAVEFRPQRPAELTANVMRWRLMQGVRLDEAMAEGLDGTIAWVVEYRRHKVQQQQWRAQNLQQQHAGERARRSEPRAKRRPATRAATGAAPAPPPLTRARRKAAAAAVAAARLNTTRLLQRYLRRLQGRGHAPDPRRLPYTQLRPAAGPLVRYAPQVRLHALRAAYDWDVVEGILMPALAYDINKHHHVDHYGDIVARRGPYKVRIRVTDAAPMLIPFLQLPFRRLAPMRKVALAVKRLTRLFRLKTVWLSNGASGLTEPRHPDGSYSVRGSRGFGRDERMFPAAHLRQWCQWEAQWEAQLEALKVTLEAVLKESPASASAPAQGLSAPVPALLWVAAIDESTEWIDRSLQWYFDHYREMLKNPQLAVYRQQTEYQRAMDAHYDVLLARYKRMVAEIDRDGLRGRHMELVGAALVLPGLLQERVGQKQQLGDYLRRHGFRSFAWGDKFDKRFEF